MTTRKALSLLAAIVACLALAEIAPALFAYAVALGSYFWSVTLAGLTLFVWIILRIRTGRGLPHWVGIGLVAFDGMADEIPGWAMDGLHTLAHRAGNAARARIALIPAREE